MRICAEKKSPLEISTSAVRSVSSGRRKVMSPEEECTSAPIIRKT